MPWPVHSSQGSLPPTPVLSVPQTSICPCRGGLDGVRQTQEGAALVLLNSISRNVGDETANASQAWMGLNKTLLLGAHSRSAVQGHS